MQMTFENISLSTSADGGVDLVDEVLFREEKIRLIADKEIQKPLKRRFRMCNVTPKFEDPKLQFFDGFMKDVAFGGIETQAQTQTRDMTEP